MHHCFNPFVSVELLEGNSWSNSWMIYEQVTDPDLIFNIMT